MSRTREPCRRCSIFDDRRGSLLCFCDPANAVTLTWGGATNPELVNFHQLDRDPLADTNDLSFTGTGNKTNNNSESNRYLHYC